MAVQERCSACTVPGAGASLLVSDREPEPVVRGAGAVPSAVGEVRMPGSLWLRPAARLEAHGPGLVALAFVVWSLWGSQEGWLGETQAGPAVRAADPAGPAAAHAPAAPSAPPPSSSICASRCWTPSWPTSVACLSTTPVPHVCRRHDCHPRPARHVRTRGAWRAAGQDGLAGGHHAASCRAPVVSTRKRKFEEDERQSIPNGSRGRARLDPVLPCEPRPFALQQQWGRLHLICKLGECWAGAAGPPARPAQPSWNLPAGLSAHTR